MQPAMARGYDEFLRGPLAQQMSIPAGTAVTPGPMGAVTVYNPPTVRPVYTPTVTVPEREQFTAPTFYSAPSHQRVLPDAQGHGGIDNWIRVTAANNNVTPSKLIEQVGRSLSTAPLERRPKNMFLKRFQRNSNNTVEHYINDDELLRQLAPYLQGTPHVLDHAL
eukprot:TRINITY_DN48678_c0_g1_i1.p1 TRINITY_DN48678_c0_g1~~TRINITY_DN48678_c0_g1_i1.p1  ORF type:complete len:165 (-),score=16.39 TRINITY_DN48678_c0_g1_i1:99-593(-)